MKNRKHKKWVWILGGGLFFALVAVFLLPYFISAEYQITEVEESIVEESVETAPKISHVPTPENVKAIYMTACVASVPSWREDLTRFIEGTELNAVVIDIKDDTGTISFIHPEFPNGQGCRVKDMREFVEELHRKDIYVIGRIAVFQDILYTKLHPELAVKSVSTGNVWRDRKGLSFIDVGAKPYWDYIISLSKASYAIGFDEINFDYVRYPTDGNTADTYYPWGSASTTGSTGASTELSRMSSPLGKIETLESFFSYLHNSLSGTDMKTSVDLFGFVTFSTSDMGIGQVLEKALPYFDYIYPMVYPSHFGVGTNGIKNPAAHPYEIIKYSMGLGVEREQAWNISEGRATSTPSKLRPWLQDFDLGANYGVAEVQAQIKATNDVGLYGWLMWDASNKYTREAYLTDN